MAKMKEQKFFRGDLVQVADDLGVSMRHFTKGCKAIVIGTYAELCYDDNNVDDYSIYILPKGGKTSWYHTHQLTLIEPNRYDLLPKNDRTRLNWEAQQARDNKTQFKQQDYTVTLGEKNGKVTLHIDSPANA